MKTFKTLILLSGLALIVLSCLSFLTAGAEDGFELEEMDTGPHPGWNATLLAGAAGMLVCLFGFGIKGGK